MNNTQVLLANRPDGMVKDTDFKIVRSVLPPLRNGQVLIKIQYVSLDPAIRGWMNAGTTYIPGVSLGSVMRAFAAGQIIVSKHPDFQAGQFVEGLFGATSLVISDGKGMKLVDLTKGTLSQHLGILGMPGMTAYFGLL